MRWLVLRAIAFATLLGVGNELVLAEPIVPGFNVEVYAHVDLPGGLSFAPNGDLYVGNSDTPAKIRRVLRGGAQVAEYGNATLRDPDSVLFDPVGTVSGEPGAVLVAGGWETYMGHISAVLPDETVVAVFGPSGEFFNINDMKFDQTGRFLATDAGMNQVLECSGGALEVFATLPTPAQSLAIDAGNNIFVSGYDGTIRVYDSFGNLTNGAFATGFGLIPRLEFGPGGAFGEDLYVLDVQAGRLFRYDSIGNGVQVGSGFSGGDFCFGSDGALYKSELADNQILRITVIPEPSILMLLSIGAVGLLLYAVGRRK